MEKKKVANPHPSPKQKNPGIIKTYEDAAHVGKMPADPLQKAVNEFPPADTDMTRKNWSSKDHVKQGKALDKSKKQKQTIEQENLNNIIGSPNSGGTYP